MHCAYDNETSVQFNVLGLEMRCLKKHAKYHDFPKEIKKIVKTQLQINEKFWQKIK